MSFNFEAFFSRKENQKFLKEFKFQCGVQMIPKFSKSGSIWFLTNDKNKENLTKTQLPHEVQKT